MLTISFQDLALIFVWGVFGCYGTVWAIRGPKSQLDLFWPVRFLVAFTAALVATVIALVAL